MDAGVVLFINYSIGFKTVGKQEIKSLYAILIHFIGKEIKDCAAAGFFQAHIDVLTGFKQHFCYIVSTFRSAFRPFTAQKVEYVPAHPVVHCIQPRFSIYQGLKRA
jgi:hypothetical protein